MQVTLGVWIFVVAKVSLEGAFGSEWTQFECSASVYFTSTTILIFSFEYVLFGSTTFIMYVCVLTKVVKSQSNQKQLGE